ncbi:hypothetical protein L1049_013837 [Liquidambar formosana]|uniref:CCHC-type domain-containing protein n=1 Tax=Liquidambar formosana TaxID=63359 RepID=A0AAP0WZ21_LIQFO
MGKREKLKAKFDYDEEHEEKASKSVIQLSSSDEEEGNEDLSLKIVQKAMSRASTRKTKAKTTQSKGVLDESNSNGGVRSLGVVDLSSSSSQDGEAIMDRSGSNGGAADAKNNKKSKKVKKKKNKKIEFEEETVDVVKEEETAEAVQAAEIVASMEPNPVEQSDNMVLRKLLRGPRYFDLPDSGWGTCYNCGEEGHTTVNCTSLKRKKPCFVCGSLEHGFKQCTKGQDCFICKRGGHRAKDCPEKHKGGSQSSKMCLRCGDSGHDMFSCWNNYSPSDLEEMQCYICKSFGHLCCVNFIDAGPREVSCYKCGQLGHTGLACTRSRGASTGVGSPSSCYRCGEGGHFARECTSSIKVGKRNRESSTPRQRFSKEDENYRGFKSAPHDLGKARKRKKTQFEERGITTPHKSKQRGGWIAEDPEDFPMPRKSKQRGGWITEDPGDFPMPHRSKQRGGWVTEDPGDFLHKQAKANSWRSPATPTNKSHKISTLTGGGQISSSRSSQKAHQRHSGGSTSQGSAKAFQHRFSASRFGDSSNDGMMRNYNW